MSDESKTEVCIHPDEDVRVADVDLRGEDGQRHQVRVEVCSRCDTIVASSHEKLVGGRFRVVPEEVLRAAAGTEDEEAPIGPLGPTMAEVRMTQEEAQAQMPHIKALVDVMERAAIDYLEEHPDVVLGSAVAAAGSILGWFAEAMIRRGHSYEGSLRELMFQSIKRGRERLHEERQATPGKQYS